MQRVVRILDKRYEHTQDHIDEHWDKDIEIKLGEQVRYEGGSAHVIKCWKHIISIDQGKKWLWCYHDVAKLEGIYIQSSWLHVITIDKWKVVNFCNSNLTGTPWAVKGCRILYCVHCPSEQKRGIFSICNTAHNTYWSVHTYMYM